MDLFALIVFVALQYALFVRSVEWMRQHVFKVGWLLTRNSRTTVIFYFTAFLPGIILRELTKWLAAGLLKARAGGAIQLPQDDEIGEHQLGLVQLDSQTGSVKRSLIGVAQLVVALAALWFITFRAFNLESSLAHLTAARIDNLTGAITALTTGADFWLWFYLVFTIANTMLPIAPKLRWGWKAVGVAGLPLGVLAVALGVLITEETANALRVQLAGLSLILFLITAINAVMALAMGLLETAVERLTGHSASFRDGKMMTMTRQEARSMRETASQTQSPQRGQGAPSSPAPSLYAFPLPIPGPPGEEPVSRPIAAVLSAAPPEASSKQINGDGQAGGGSPTIVGRSSKLPQMKTPSQPVIIAGNASAANDGIEAGNRASADDGEKHATSKPTGSAPFSRPFAHSEAEEEDSAEADARETGAPFSRPFAHRGEQDSRAGD